MIFCQKYGRNEFIVSKIKFHIKKFISKFRNKTSTAILTKRSPVMVAILPSPQESSEWLFKRRGNSK